MGWKEKEEGREEEWHHGTVEEKTDNLQAWIKRKRKTWRRATAEQVKFIVKQAWSIQSWPTGDSMHATMILT